jgi:hypothetical protein
MSTYRGLYWLKATKGTSRTGTERAQTLSALLGHMRGHDRLVAKMYRISGWILLLLAEGEGLSRPRRIKPASRLHLRSEARRIRRELRRRSAIEAVIGHMKTEGHLGRCYLKGMAGDAANAILTAVGHNLRLVLAWLRILLCLILAALWSDRFTRPRLKSAC